MPDLPNPWIESRFVLNVEDFMEQVQLLPAFIESPRREYLETVEKLEIVAVIAESINR